MKFLQKKWTTVLLGILLLLLLSACGSRGEDSGPQSPSTIGRDGNSAPSFSTIGGQSGTLVETSSPADAYVDEDGNEIPAEEGPDVYVYQELEDAGAAVDAYTQVLLDNNFAIVNAAGKSVEPPDFTDESGFIVLSRASYEFKNTLRLTILWEEGQCTVRAEMISATPARTPETASTQGNTLSMAELSVLQNATSRAPDDTATTADDEGDANNSPLPPATVSGGTSSSGTTSGGSTAANEVVSFFQATSPSVLGLEGESMDQYNIYYVEGTVMVNDSPCSRVRIYVLSQPAGTNAFLGTFLLSADGHIYQHDLENDVMIELSK